MGKAMPQVKMIAATEMTMVSVSRSPMASATSVYSIAIPKLPCMIRPYPLCVLHGHRLVEAELLAQRLRFAFGHGAARRRHRRDI